MKFLKIIFSSLLIIPATLFLPFLNSATAASCNNVVFIFARGSGETLNDVNYQEFKTKIEENLAENSLKYEFYELGSEAQDGYQYPAVEVGINTISHTITTIGAFVGAGKAYTFGDSIKTGEKELLSYINSINSTCKDTKFVLAGYSQGGLVISNAIQNIDSSKIIYAATLGDPKLYLPEGSGSNPDACHGKNLSEYRAYVPDCKAYEGLLGKKDPYQPADYNEKLGVWCNYLDIMCSRHFYIFDPLKGHVSYISDNLYDKLAKIINNKLSHNFPDKIAEVEVDSSTHDVAILIDSTGSMSKLINSYRSEAIELAEEVTSDGGRVALYEYRDLKDPFEPVRHCGFETCTMEVFTEEINSIRTGGGGDTPESAMSAALTALNTENWKPGATKSIVILTDTGYPEVDIDGATLEQVTKRSLEIDPVNFYIITTPKAAEKYQTLAESTSGKVFDATGELSLSTHSIIERPVAILSNLEYSALVGDELFFDSSSSTTSSNIVSYEWDLDCDGIFETTSDAPTISKTYSEPIFGYVQVKITDENGLFSTMSAKIEVSDFKEEPSATVEIINSSENENSITIDFSTTNSEKIFLILNDALLGELTEKHFTITDLDKNTSNIISLVPYSASGERGEAQTIIVSSSQKNTDQTATIKAPDAGVIKTTWNLDASDHQTHIYKRQDF